MIIEYLLWAPDCETFRHTMASLINPMTGEPIATYEDGNFSSADGIRIDEIGPVTKTRPTYDDEGNELTPAEVIPGWHVNMAAVGAVAQMLVEGIPTEGTIFERTRILQLLGAMEWQPSAVGEPAGYVGASGVKIFDPAAVDNRMRVWAR